MLSYSVVVCSSFGSDENGQDMSTCPAGDLIQQFIEVPEIVDYQAAFINPDTDVIGALFGGGVLLFVVGIGIGLLIRVLRLRTRV